MKKRNNAFPFWLIPIVIGTVSGVAISLAADTVGMSALSGSTVTGMAIVLLVAVVVVTVLALCIQVLSGHISDLEDALHQLQGSVDNELIPTVREHRERTVQASVDLRIVKEEIHRLSSKTDALTDELHIRRDIRRM